MLSLSVIPLLPSKTTCSWILDVEILGYPSWAIAASFLGYNHKPSIHILLRYQKGSFLPFLFLYCRSFAAGCHPVGGERNMAAIGLMFKSSVKMHRHGPMIGLGSYKCLILRHLNLWVAWSNFFFFKFFYPNWKLVTWTFKMLNRIWPFLKCK